MQGSVTEEEVDVNSSPSRMFGREEASLAKQLLGLQSFCDASFLHLTWLNCLLMCFAFKLTLIVPEFVIRNSFWWTTICLSFLPACLLCKAGSAHSPQDVSFVCGKLLRHHITICSYLEVCFYHIICSMKDIVDFCFIINSNYYLCVVVFCVKKVCVFMEEKKKKFCNDK